MTGWKVDLRYDPRPALMAAEDAALRYWVRRDLLGERGESAAALWELPAVTRVLSQQGADGGWPYSNRKKMVAEPRKYGLIETFRQLGVLVGLYGLNREHQALRRAADYLLGLQTAEGDIRGILDNQTMPYYHGMILAYLIEAGYAGDPRVEKGLQWLLSTRQADGGWVIAAQTVPAKQKTADFWHGPALTADPSQPSSHLATGMALRAFAVHPAYQDAVRCPAAQQTTEAAWVLQAADRLKGRFFRADSYNDRRAPEYWTKFKIPFWWPDLLSGLDALARLGYPGTDAHVRRGLDWFVKNQAADGLWPTGYGTRSRQDEALRLWIGLAVCRLLA